VLFLYLIGGDFLENMRERGMGPVVQLILLQLKASNLFVAFLTGSLPTALGLFIAPVVSMLSDRHRGRWGRRIPFIAVPLPIVVVSMIGLALAPSLGSHLHAWLGDASPGANFCALGFFILFWSIYDVASVVTSAVFGGLLADVVPQAVMGRFMGLWRASSLLAGILFNYFLIGHAEKEYFWMLTGMAILYGIGYGVICWKVKEGNYPPPEQLPANTKFVFYSGMLTYLRECFAQPFYLLYFFARTVGGLAFAPFNTFSLFYMKNIGVDIGFGGKFTALTYAISFVLSYLLGSLADRFHPLRLGLAFLSIYALVALGGWFLAGSPNMFLVFYVLHGVVSGAFMTGVASLHQRILPRDRFAQFASAGGIVGALAYMIIPAAIGFLIDISGNNYRITFLLNAGFTLVALILFALFFRAWKKHGGDSAYIAP
jgi:MFS family permease